VTTCQQRPQIWDTKGGRCTQVVLQLIKEWESGPGFGEINLRFFAPPPHVLCPQIKWKEFTDFNLPDFEVVDDEDEVTILTHLAAKLTSSPEPFFQSLSLSKKIGINFKEILLTESSFPIYLDQWFPTGVPWRGASNFNVVFDTFFI